MRERIAERALLYGLLDHVREVIRKRHYSVHTEQAYVEDT